MANLSKPTTPKPSTRQAIAMPNRTVIWKALAALVVTVIIGACSGSPPVPSITLTFIRHAESESNAAQIINTDVPGPSLTEQGRAQAEQLAHQLSHNSFTAIYTSDMVRTQETAAPLAHALGKQWNALSGLNEIDAGKYENTPTRPACLHDEQVANLPKDRWVDATCSPYLLAPADWLNGDREDGIPGSKRPGCPPPPANPTAAEAECEIDGNSFNDQFTAAVQEIYKAATDSHSSKPVAFSHAEAIMYWTLMNVKNPKDSLVTSHPLPNLGRVVVTGSPATGWTLVDWDGIRDFNF
jgi:broad specificity phosphatase PhoE